MARVFISYRRDDSAGHASRLYDHLNRHYPQDVFIDVEQIDDGKRWDREIRAKAEACKVLLVVIGPKWLTAQDKAGRRRIDQRNDWVRNEIAAGLTNGALVIPILVDNATIPAKNDLPKSIQELVLHQDRPFRHRGAETDVAELIARIEKVLGPATQTPAADPTAYLNWLHRETGYIDIKGLQVSQQKAYRFRIDELYTPLTTVIAEEEARHQSVPLQKALKHPRVVLVGDPGAGKSTFLNRIAFAACETLLGIKPEAAQELLGEEHAQFPILIRAASLSTFITGRIEKQLASPPDNDSPEWLLHYLEWKSGESNWGLPPGFFSRKLKSGCLLLFDGLDEAPDRARRKNLAHLLAKLDGWAGPSRIVVTSRPSAYGGETSITSYRTIQIAPLGDKAIGIFVDNWCRALYPGDEAAAAKHRGGLSGAIASRPDIRNLVVNPVMLTALAVLHWNERRLPDQRADLYESVLIWLSRARDEMRARDRVTAERCIALMQHLAYTMHANEKGMQVEIGPHAAAMALADRFRGIPADEQMAAAGSFLQDEEIDSGILVGREGKLKFWHRTFQEYLAARALAGKDSDRRRLLFDEKKLYVSEWRETVLLLGGVLCRQDTERIDGFLCEMLDAVDHAPLAERARCVGLIGRMLRDLKAWKYEIADNRYRRHLTDALVLFSDARLAREVEFQTRLDVADAFGQVGDPRLTEHNKWVLIQGGTCLIGSTEDNNWPVHSVTLKSFWMGRYPVTVAEYAEYIAAGEGTAPDDWERQLPYPNRPVVYVDWQQASGYCEWAGGCLPTEAEWEYAARSGRAEVLYPWGCEEPETYKANFDLHVGYSTPVGMYPEGATPTGLFDMAGNVNEWCQDKGRVQRGGDWFDVAPRLRVSYRLRSPLTERVNFIGFRCLRHA